MTHPSVWDSFLKSLSDEQRALLTQVAEDRRLQGESALRALSSAMSLAFADYNDTLTLLQRLSPPIDGRGEGQGERR